MAERGLPDKAVWVTELGVPIWSEHPGPCWDPSSPWRATVAEQAAYVWLASAEAVGAAVEALIFFQAYDDCGNGPDSYDAFGLIRNHAGNQCWTPPDQTCWTYRPELAGMPRPAHDALEIVARELANAELLWRPSESAPRWQRILLYRPPDQRVTVAWNWSRSEQAVDLTATGPSATRYALDDGGMASVTTLLPSAGAYRVVLPGATNRNQPGNGAAVMAGRPLILVERDTVPPFRAQVADLPEVSPARISIAVDAADGGTGVGAFQLWVTDDPHDRPPRWRALTPEIRWPALPRGGRVEVPFEGVPGANYGFAAQAVDRAGNRTSMPDVAQAVTRVAATIPAEPDTAFLPAARVERGGSTAPTGSVR